MNSVQLAIHISDSSIREELIAKLSLLEVDGFEEDDENLFCYFTEGKMEKPQIDKIIKQYNVPSTCSTIQSKNWNELWESSFEPVVIDDFCTIRASFHKRVITTTYEIVITPKMSFGTGHHATTYLMVEQMKTINFIVEEVADFGTGTGVLAILAEKLGSHSIWAIDNDDWSINNAKENIERNNCKAIQLQKANSFSPTKKFDIILANINKNVILQNLGGLVFGLKTGGHLLLSGLLKSDEKVILNLFTQKNFLHLSTVEKDSWISILFTK